jgi:carboxyl-terminal processing protease
MKVRERFVWIIAAVFSVSLLSLLIITPSAQAQSDTEGTRKYLNLFEQVFRFVQNNYVEEVSPEMLFEGALKGMFESLDDPYSAYLSEEDMQDLRDTTSGKFGGVGLYISKSPKRENIEEETNEYLRQNYSPYVRVVAPIEGTPASRSGISAGDYIIKIEGESTENMTIDEVVDKLRGTPGTEVQITIQRAEDITFPVTLSRAIIEVPTVKYAMIKDDIGFLRIIQFTPLTDDRVKEAITFFKENNYKSMIIDVRTNPGGLLTAVVDTVDLFFQGGTIVSTRSRVPSENAVYSADQGVSVRQNIPIAVLINEGSASASEILAGAFKDRDRGTLVGETTFGKGSVQQVKSFGEGGFKLTMSKYFTPSGTNIDHIGIKPDVEVKEPELSEKEQKAYKKILEDNLIGEFVNNNPDPSDEEINGFITSLEQRGIEMRERLLKKLIRNEITKTMNNPPIYDLEYDIVLQKGVEIVETKMQQ